MTRVPGITVWSPKWWAEFSAEGPEIACFRALIDRYGQPALDVACGTGRLLLPYLRDGLDVDGCDISPDMLAWCRSRAKQQGLAPVLYRQAMYELDLPRVYRTVYVCGAFGIGGNRGHDQGALRRFWDHLRPGGALVMDTHLPYGDARTWQYWLKDNRRALPEAPPPPPRPRAASDGSDLDLSARVVDFDPLAQVITREIRARRWRHGHAAHRARTARAAPHLKGGRSNDSGKLDGRLGHGRVHLALSVEIRPGRVRYALFSGLCEFPALNR